MEEKIVIKGKTNSLVCVLMCLIVILVSNTIVVKLFNNIPENDTTSTIATIWMCSVVLYFFLFIFSIIFFTKMANSNINVTDSMVFGKTVRKNFYISYKEITNVKLESLKGINIEANNKNYKVYFLKNNEEIYNQISKKVKK